MVWKEVPILTDSGETVIGVAPLIISASRSTDIPAFHSEWLIDRLKQGYVCRVNPFNRTNTQCISFQEVRLFVFWTKNPDPLINHLALLDELGLNYYFQFTLNDYEKEGFEPNVPSLESRIRTFIRLSETIGKEKVIWRFDPLLLTKQLTVNELLARISSLGERLVRHTDQLVFSFADILAYRKVQNSLIRRTDYFTRDNIGDAEFTHDQQFELAAGIQQLLRKWRTVNPDFQVATCAEGTDLEQYGIAHNRCIDDELIARLFPNDSKLMAFLGRQPKLQQRLEFGEDAPGNPLKNLKDKGQRKACGCIYSKDIGSYNTCNHLCVYCYADDSPQKANKNIARTKYFRL